jgi:hypothetical protein
MKTTILRFVCAYGVALLLVDICPAQIVLQKKLIGWSNEPSTAFMRAHIAEMEATPFDGCVFHVDTKDANGATDSFAWKCWSKKAFTEAEVQPAIDDLKATPFKRLTSNFLRFNVCPGDVDWFDDFSPIVSNARLAARVAHEGKAAGLLFDVEQYGKPLFTYRKQRDAVGKSFEQYAAQARLRGRELMLAFQEGYPNLHVLLTYGYCLSLREARGAKNPADTEYSLLAPFLDGMFNAATGSSKIIDGHEYSYGYKAPAQFDDARKQFYGGDLFRVIGTDTAKVEKHLALGFGVWLDNAWRTNGWNPADVEKNYFTPASFEQSVRFALERSDEYVWIYTEKPCWWSTDGKPRDLPPAYEQALRRALKHDAATVSASQ